jgi:hypothetical protein
MRLFKINGAPGHRCGGARSRGKEQASRDGPDFTQGWFTVLMDSVQRESAVGTRPASECHHSNLFTLLLKIEKIKFFSIFLKRISSQ